MIFFIYEAVNIIIFILPMMRDYSFKGLPEDNRASENYQSTSSNISQMKSSCNSQRLEEIRRKYDTPTRKELKEIQVRPDYNNGSKELMRASKHSYLEEASKQENYGMRRNADIEQIPYRKENSKNDEEAVFKKIKEMKDSLLGGRGSYDKAKVTRSIYEPSRDPRPTSGLDDHRIENIDKINSKIQQILSCLK